MNTRRQSDGRVIPFLAADFRQNPFRQTVLSQWQHRPSESRGGGGGDGGVCVCVCVCVYVMCMCMCSRGGARVGATGFVRIAAAAALARGTH